ncbi:MAG: SRPBCC family protein [Candidatus Micrarchaeota archaeon]|nr:SRPBCC family protein [Candidatus Micrarchaeota archaeon]
MQTRTIRQTVLFHCSPHAVFELLMDSKKHSKFTGGKATVSRKVGGKFSIFDGGLYGKNLELKKDRKIVQAWACKMNGWPAEHFSIATFTFAAAKGGTKLTLVQPGVPAGCFKDISNGWYTYYWEPMKEMLEE